MSDGSTDDVPRDPTDDLTRDLDDDVSRDVMAATYRALCEHGYADLTMQDIAAHSDRSKAALHYHYDTKRTLLLEFLDHLYELFTDRVGDPEGDTPGERLTSFIDAVLTPPEPDDHPHEAFGTAILELKAQAPYDEEVRRRMRAFDEFLVEHVHSYVAAGIDAGEFRDVDPEDTARFIVTAIDGARTKEVAVGREMACTSRMLQTYVREHLTPDSDPPDGPGDGPQTDDRVVRE